MELELRDGNDWNRIIWQCEFANGNLRMFARVIVEAPFGTEELQEKIDFLINTCRNPDSFKDHQDKTLLNLWN